MLLLRCAWGTMGGGALDGTHLCQPKVFKRWDFEPAQVQLVVVAGVHARRGACQHLSRQSWHCKVVHVLVLLLQGLLRVLCERGCGQGISFSFFLY